LLRPRTRPCKDTHTLEPRDLKAAPSLLRSAVLYGANASGKSNLIKALQYMRGVVMESATVIQPGQTYAVQPFRLDADRQSADRVRSHLHPGRRALPVRLCHDRAAHRQRTPAGLQGLQAQRWFERHFDEETGKDVYDFGPGLKGPKNLWEGATRPNALFLSMAVQLNSEGLAPGVRLVRQSAGDLQRAGPAQPRRSRFQMLKQAEGRKQICDFLRAADISIADIEVVTRKVPGRQCISIGWPGKTEVRCPRRWKSIKLRFSHVTEQGGPCLT
jgi:uncharacterized protein